MKTFLPFFCLLFVSANCLSQDLKDVFRILVDSEDSTVIAYATWHKIDSTSSIEDASFHFDSIFEGHYEIKTFMLTPQTEHSIKLDSDEGYVYCLDTSEIKTFFKKMPHITYTIYYYGMPRYSDIELNKIGLKYGVRWNNMGCMADDSFDIHNDRVKSILSKRNGENWMTDFWEEAEKTLK